MKAETRDRKRPIKVYVTPTERKTIEKNAKKSSKESVGAFLRDLGQGVEPKSKFDAEAIEILSKLNADQGRLGGLLKLWLSEKPGQGARVSEVRDVLRQIESYQMLMNRWLLQEAKLL